MIEIGSSDISQAIPPAQDWWGVMRTLNLPDTSTRHPPMPALPGVLEPDGKAPSADLAIVDSRMLGSLDRV